MFLCIPNQVVAVCITMTIEDVTKSQWQAEVPLVEKHLRKCCVVVSTSGL